MNKKGFIDFPGFSLIICLIWAGVLVYFINKDKPKVQIIRVMEYAVGRCIVPHNGEDPFIITKIKDDTMASVCVKKYIKVPNKAYNTFTGNTTNMEYNTENCMPVEFWDDMINEYHWDVKRSCDEAAL